MEKAFGQIGMGRYLSRRLFPLSAGLALLLTVLAPVTYWIFEHRHLQHMSSLYAEGLAEKFRHVALKSPTLWKYQTYDFMSIAEGFHSTIDVDSFRILDEKGEPISGFEHKSDMLKHGGKLTFTEELGFTLGSAPIMFNDRRVGTVEVLACDTILLRTTALLFCFSSLIGTAIAVLVYRFPVRVVRKMEGEINELIADLRRSEEMSRGLNEELEQKVEQRTSQLLDAQEDLVRTEKLSILGRLSGSVGHELRNPLGVMSNAVYYLQMVLADADETTREYLEIIKHEIDNSQRIISDLLDFARTKTPQVKAVTACDLVNGSLGRCAVPENVELRTELPDTLPALKVDPLQMGQVLQNVITNAVQAMPNGGALRIAARRVRCSMFEVRGTEQNVERRTPNVEPDGDFIEISVEDTGEGISPEGMKRLFQPLFTTKPRGIGLGLTVCKNLIEANCGRIEVESRLGAGTTFTLILPVGD